MSVTVTLKEHVTELPPTSVAVDVTVVVPTGKNEPDAGTDTTFAEQLSVVLTLKFTTAPHAPGSTLALIKAGQIITGFSRSFTVTLKLHVVLLPDGSVAV